MNQRNLISSKMGIIIGIIIALILTYFGISYWISTLIALIVIIILANTRTVDSGSGSTAGESNADQQQVGTPSRNYTGSIISIIFLALVIVVGWWLINAFSETPDKTYSAQEILSYKNKTYGNCEVVKNNFVCKGPWSITLPGDKKIKEVRAYQSLGYISLTKKLTFVSGKWQIDLYHEGITCRAMQPTVPLYKANIFYDGISDGDCYAAYGTPASTEPKVSVPEPPIRIKVPSAFWNSGNPEIWIGDKIIGYGTVKTDRIFVFGEPLEIRWSGQDKTSIDRIEVQYV